MSKISIQFQLRISFQQFDAMTTARRGEVASQAKYQKAVTWNVNMKSKKHMQLRKELGCKEFGMIQARQQKPPS